MSKLKSITTRFRLISLALAVALFSLAAHAQAIHFDAATHVFRIDTPAVTYAIGVNPKGELQAIYWGAPLASTDPLPTPVESRELSGMETSTTITPYEYRAWGGLNFTEPDLKITFPDGNRDLVLHYVSHKIDADRLTITTKDISREVFVDLIYTVDPATGVIGRSLRHHQPHQSPSSPSSKPPPPPGTSLTAPTTR